MPVMNTFGAVYNRSWGAGSTLPIFQDIPNQRGNYCAVVANQVAVALYQQKPVSYTCILYSSMMRIAQAADVWDVPITNIVTFHSHV